ncbi:hypothetical protein [Mesorhizobium opportunistum]|uniref:hypothetical protein n=1 Tax=Mesorhizobium opportunistum TaxID=593909 RepID=UPI00059B0EAF|nr:hypothetical protein [Mesorhizobium opportunistum]
MADADVPVLTEIDPTTRDQLKAAISSLVAEQCDKKAEISVQTLSNGLITIGMHFSLDIRIQIG